jgi:uncharacterized tellurite resistance protein B-like protein
MKDRLPLVADILMDAAHADSRLAGEEKPAVRRILRELLGKKALPIDLDFRVDEFAPQSFDLTATAAAFTNDPPAVKRRLLELVAAVHAADGELDLAEDAQLRRVAAAMGLGEESFQDLVVTVVEEVDLEALRFGLSPSPPGDGEVSGR